MEQIESQLQFPTQLWVTLPQQQNGCSFPPKWSTTTIDPLLWATLPKPTIAHTVLIQNTTNKLSLINWNGFTTTAEPAQSHCPPTSHDDANLINTHSWWWELL